MSDPVPEGGAEASEGLLEGLTSLYWDAVEREIRILLLFFNDLKQLEFEDVDEDVDVESQNFKKMLRLWIGKTRGSWDDIEDSTLYKNTMAGAKSHRNVNRSVLLARYLLQSCGLLDIDVLYEPPYRLFPSFNRGSPDVEKLCIPDSSTENIIHDVLRGIYCSECQLLIRSMCYYECTQGCEERKDSSRPTVILQTKFVVREDDATDKVLKHQRRLCPACCVGWQSDAHCDQAHLRKVYHTNPTEKFASRFQSVLDKREDWIHMKDANTKALYRVIRTFKGLASEKRSNALKLALLVDWSYLTEGFLQTLDVVVTTVRDNVTPAGPFHVAMMFGPLVFESGVRKTKHGILISPRPCAELFSDGRAISALVDDEEERLDSGYMANAIVYYKDKYATTKKQRGKVDVTRKFECRRVAVMSRPTVAYVKRVYGAAFSGYNESQNVKQSSIIDAFVKEAERCHFRPSKTVAAKRRQLFSSSKIIRNLLQASLGGEVKKHLSRIEAVLLDPKTKITYHQWTNNCQMFVAALLGGKDFEYVFPRFATPHGIQPEQDADSDGLGWPQYLLSFGERLEKTHGVFSQRKSLIENFFVAEEREYDLIDFLDYAVHKYRTSETFQGYISAYELTLDPEVESEPSSKNVLEALWELPRDTLSILQSHLRRPAWKYRTISGQLLDDRAWMKNRLLALRKLDLFASVVGSLGSAVMATVAHNPSITSRIVIPKAHVYGNLHAHDRIRILKTSLSNVAYIITREKDKQLPAFMDNTDTEVSEIVSSLLDAANKMCTKLSMSTINFTSKERQMFRKLLHAPTMIISPKFLFSVYPNTTELVGKIKAMCKRGSWNYIDFGVFILVQQTLGENKATRKPKSLGV